MIGILSLILCWIRQFGALMLNALIDFLNLIFAGIGALVTGIFEAWPIAMPDLPEAPEALGEAFGWVKWTPLPVSAAFAFILFALTVYVAWLGVSVVLRWAKVID